jgi:leucyl-tRNA synthetase
MELSNMINSYRDNEEQDLCVLKEAVDNLLVLLSPFSPHICEELWHCCGHEDSVYRQPWPVYDPQALIQDEVEIVLQISGKVRDRVVVPTASSKEELEKIALANSKIKELTKGKEIVKVIVVPGKLVNIVAK